MSIVSPFLEINLDKIRYNAAQVVSRCHEQGIEVLGVTKGFSATPRIVSALIEGGVDGLADARMENIIELRENGFDLPITLLRIPRLSNVKNVVRFTDISVNSELAVIRALAQAAQDIKRTHPITLMVDVGDLREGVLKEHVLDTARQILRLKGVKLLGLGTNMGCFGGVLPSPDNLNLLVDLAKTVEDRLQLKINIISGGGTSTLTLIENHKVPAGVNQLRIGEGLLLGTDTTHNRKIPWLCDDAFLLHVEVIEVKSKPSIPIGNIGRDAFGNVPQFVDIGIRKRAILAIGKQDVYVEGIIPVDDGITVLGASSDHLIVDISDAANEIKVGDEVTFRLSYSGLLSSSSSRYVGKKYKGGAVND